MDEIDNFARANRRSFKNFEFTQSREACGSSNIIAMNEYSSGLVSSLQYKHSKSYKNYTSIAVIALWVS